MAKTKKNSGLRDTLHARGLRRNLADAVADALGNGSRRSQQPKAVQEVVKTLKGLAGEIEDRATGGSSKRSAAAKKAAATRKRNAAKRGASSTKRTATAKAKPKAAGAKRATKRAAKPAAKRR